MPLLPADRPRGRLLLVDDDRALREMAGAFLRHEGHQVVLSATLEGALAELDRGEFDLVITDLLLDRGSGLDLLREIKAKGLDWDVIIMTGHGGVETAVEAIRQGAYDYITKPLLMTRLALEVSKVLEKRRLQQDLAQAHSQRTHCGGLFGCSPAMQGVFTQLQMAGRVQSNVLLLGESGTGKELAARAVHDHSERRLGPFVAVNCGAIPGELLESELFGHMKGAFTGADRNHRGLFSAAAGGTLFLDEIGTASARAQVGLLRAVQERRIRPVGSDTDQEVDVRIIAATNADLDEKMAEGDFRQDLYYRLATLVIRIPPVRDRREDIPLLVEVILDRLSKEGRRLTVAPRALERLVGYDWPGNVRELAHVLERAALMAKGVVIGEKDLALPDLSNGDVLTLDAMERAHIARVLELSAGNKLKAARMLGIPRPTLYRKIERFGLEKLPRTDRRLDSQVAPHHHSSIRPPEH